jgi:hypothetical protein
VDRIHLVPWTSGILIGLKEVYHVEDAGIDERILLKLDSKMQIASCGLNLCGSELEPLACCCEYGDELSDSVKGWEFLD